MSELNNRSLVMQYDVSTPDEYLDALDTDWRKEKLHGLRTIILKQDSAIEETINYKMLCFKLKKRHYFI